MSYRPSRRIILLSGIVTHVGESDYIVWFEFIESNVFSKQIRQLSGEVLTNIQTDLVQNPKRGALVKGTHGVRKARVADPSSTRGKSGRLSISVSLP